MARKKKTKNPQVEDYRHEDVKRKTNPQAIAGLSLEGDRRTVYSLQNNSVPMVIYSNIL